MTSSRRWSVVILLSLGMVIAYFDRTALSVALATHDFKTFFRLSNADRGMMNSVFFWSYALLQVPSGWVVDRFGVKYPYAISFLFWSLVATATGMATAVWHLVVFRLLLGVGEAVVSPASMRWLRLNCPEKERGLAVGVYMAGTKAGPALGAMLASFLVAAYNWRTMFFVMGLAPLLWVAVWQWLVSDDDRQKAAAISAKSPSADQPFSELLKSPVIWAIVIATFCYNSFIFFCMTWLPAYFTEQRHLSVRQMGIYTMCSFMGMALMAPVAGWAADRMVARGRDAVSVRRWFTIIGFLIASTEVVGAMSHSNTVALVFAIVSLAGLGLATANYWALTQTLVPAKAIGRVSGLQNFGSTASGMCIPWIAGWLIQQTGNYEAPMQLISVLLLIGAACYLFVVRDIRKPLPAVAMERPAA
jgi:MFS transporter, ACS family, D-galactonate transporter